MSDNEADRIGSELVSRGWATFPLETYAAESFQRLAIAGDEFFRAPENVRRRSEWTGHGMWAGYQPMPPGDPRIIDQLDRFEVSQTMLGSSESEWPWLSPEARALRAALSGVNSIARGLVRVAVEATARAASLDPDAAARLWCQNDASTLVVNKYRSDPSVDRALAVKMKPHADFGGLSLIHVGLGLEALQFQTVDGWQSVASAGRGKDLAVMLIGQLFAHWLGVEAPIHQVVQQSCEARMSTVYFNQPSLDAVIVNEDGESVIAGRHIFAMQAYYNNIGTPTA